MYLPSLAERGLLPTPTPGPLGGVPVEVQWGVVSPLARELALRGTAGLTSEHHVRWTMDCLGHAFGFPLKYLDAMSDALDVYCRWLQRSESTPQCMVETPEAFLPTLVGHLSLLFVAGSEGSDSNQNQSDLASRAPPSRGASDRHLALCRRGLRTLEAVCVDASTAGAGWIFGEWVLRVMIGACDAVVSRRGDEPDVSRDHCDLLSDDLLRTTFKLWQAACKHTAVSDQMWRLCRDHCRRWRHRACFVNHWSAAAAVTTDDLLESTQTPRSPPRSTTPPIEPHNDLDASLPPAPADADADADTNTSRPPDEHDAATPTPSPPPAPEAAAAAIENPAPSETALPESPPRVAPPMPAGQVWRRMLCLLGNPEDLNPEVNAVAIRSLALIIEKLLLYQTDHGKPSSADILDVFENWLFTAALSERGPQTAKETAVGLLCRIFLHHNHGASVSLNKLGRFYHLLVQGLAEATLTEAIFHTCTEIFWSDLPGTTVLIWPFIQAATTVFKQPAADDDRVMLMQYAAARIISSIVCHPAVRTPGASLRVLPVVEDALETKTISQAAVEERLLVCCCEALSTCTDVQTEQVLLHAVFMINIQTLLSPRIQVGLSERLQEKITFVANHILKQLTPKERSVELTLTRFAILRGYLAMHAKYGDMKGCVDVVRAVCEYIEAQVRQPPFRQTKNLHTMILAAYNCLTSAINVMPSVVKSDEALRNIVRAVALGLTGSVLDGKLVEPEWSITTSGPRRLFASRFRDSAQVTTRSPSFRVQEAAVTLFNHLLGTDQKSGADHRTLDQDLASVHGFRVNQIRYFVMDEKAIVGVVVPPHVDDNVDDESEDAGVLLIIRDDVGKYVWHLCNTNEAHHVHRGTETPSFRITSGPTEPMPVDEVAAVPPPPNPSVVSVSDAEEKVEPMPSDVPIVISSEHCSPDGLSAPQVLKNRLLSRGSFDLPTDKSEYQGVMSQPMPEHTAASLERCHRDLVSSAAYDAVSRACAAQTRDDEQRDAFVEDEADEVTSLNSDTGSDAGTDVDMSSIAFLAHLGGLKPNTDDTRTPMGRFREIVCPLTEINAALTALDELTYDQAVAVHVLCLKPELDCSQCYPVDVDALDDPLPEKFVEFYALLCQSSHDCPRAACQPQRFVWETLVLNIEPAAALPKRECDIAFGSAEIAVIWANNSTQLTAMAQRVQTPAIIVCPLPDGLYLTSVYSGTERAPAFLTHAIPLSGRILHEMLCRAIANLALELVWGTDGYVFPHHRRQKSIQTVIKNLAPLSTSTTALHEFIATNMTGCSNSSVESSA